MTCSFRLGYRSASSSSVSLLVPTAPVRTASSSGDGAEVRPHGLGISSAFLEVLEPAVGAGFQQLRQNQRRAVHTARCGAHDGQHSLLRGLRAMIFAVHHKAGGALLRDSFDRGTPTTQYHAT